MPGFMDTSYALDLLANEKNPLKNKMLKHLLISFSEVIDRCNPDLQGPEVLVEFECARRDVIKTYQSPLTYTAYTQALAAVLGYMHDSDVCINPHRKEHIVVLEKGLPQHDIALAQSWKKLAELLDKKIKELKSLKALKKKRTAFRSSPSRSTSPLVAFLLLTGATLADGGITLKRSPTKSYDVGDILDQSVIDAINSLMPMIGPDGSIVQVSEVQKVAMNLNRPDSGGDTALHAAVKGGKSELITSMLSQYADMYAINRDGKFAIEIAISNSDWKIVHSFFKAKFDITRRSTKSGKRVVDQITPEMHEKLSKYEYGFAYWDVIFRMASTKEAYKKDLAPDGSLQDLNYAFNRIYQEIDNDPQHFFLIHKAILRWDVLRLDSTKFLKMLREFKKAGHDKGPLPQLAEPFTEFGYTAIGLVNIAKNTDAFKCLLEVFPELATKPSDNEGNSPWHIAISRFTPEELEKYFIKIKKPINVNIALLDTGDAALHYMSKYQETHIRLEWLLSHGAKRDVLNKKGQFPINVAIENHNAAGVLTLLKSWKEYKLEAWDVYKLNDQGLNVVHQLQIELHNNANPIFRQSLINLSPETRKLVELAEKYDPSAPVSSVKDVASKKVGHWVSTTVVTVLYFAYKAYAVVTQNRRDKEEKQRQKQKEQQELEKKRVNLEKSENRMKKDLDIKQQIFQAKIRDVFSKTICEIKDDKLVIKLSDATFSDDTNIIYAKASGVSERFSMPSEEFFTRFVSLFKDKGYQIETDGINTINFVMPLFKDIDSRKLAIDFDSVIGMISAEISQNKAREEEKARQEAGKQKVNAELKLHRSPAELSKKKKRMEEASGEMKKTAREMKTENIRAKLKFANKQQKSSQLENPSQLSTAPEISAVETSALLATRTEDLDTPSLVLTAEEKRINEYVADALEALNTTSTSEESLQLDRPVKELESTKPKKSSRSLVSSSTEDTPYMARQAQSSVSSGAALYARSGSLQEMQSDPKPIILRQSSDTLSPVDAAHSYAKKMVITQDIKLDVKLEQDTEDKIVADCAKHFALSFYMTRYFVSLRVAAVENVSAVDIRNFLAHRAWLLTFKQVQEAVNEFVGQKNLADFCLRYIPRRFQESLADAKQNEEKSFDLTSTKLYEYMHKIVGQQTTADIENPKELVLEHIRYINAIAHPMLKHLIVGNTMRDPSAAELKDIVKDVRDVTNIAALKNLFMIIGELDQHVKREDRSPQLHTLLLKCGRGYGRNCYSVRNTLHHKLLHKSKKDSISLRDVIMLCRHAYKIGKENNLSLSLFDAPLFKATKAGESKAQAVRSSPDRRMFA